ncbi:hypothetical protein PSHT_12600 [Puccinia striiformis]|uniref:E3 ubiquitin protein ligase n=1 Tax=Puccinia striiformis TaxID=27350 RepID=A0A2S4UVM9_9BASI|nr:hypothetical protein PSHT_12600 [Puccinia striiformis]
MSERSTKEENRPNAGPIARKKPMLNASTPSPILDTNHLNPSDRTQSESVNHLNQSVGDDDLLENFRKEALWRQLQEYKRDLKRARKESSNPSLKRVMWSPLIEDVRILFKDSCTDLDSSTHATIMSLPSSPTSLDRALYQRSTASKDLIVHLISLASSSSVASPDLEEIRARCHRLTAESASSRAALGLAESKLKQLQDQLDAAQRRLGGLKKNLIESAVEPSKNWTPRVKVHLHPKPPRQNGNGTHDDKPPSLTTCNGTHSPDHDISKQLTNSRSRELELLKEQLLQRAHEIDVLNWKIINLPDEIVRDTPAFKRLKAEVAHATLELERVRSLLETTQKEADDLRERQEEFRTKIVAEMTKRMEDMEKKLSSKDADVTRIRATREETRSELHELKTRDVEKMKQVAQIRTLANSQDRINALSSEVRRLKMRLAADVGDRHTVDFLATNEEIAEETIKSLTTQIEQISQDSRSEDSAALIRSEAEARRDLVIARQRVESIDALLGPDGNAETTEMAERLQVEVDRRQALEAKLAAQEASASMLFTEVDRLSTAWALLDEQNRDKVFKLAEHDEKVLKAVHECNASQRGTKIPNCRAGENGGKTDGTISKMSDELRAVSARLTSAEREITIHQKMVEAHKTKTTELSIENADLIARCSQHDQKVIELSTLLRDRTAQAETEASARRTAEENVINLEKEIQRSKLAGTNGRGGLEPAEVAELRSFNDDLTRFKSHVITRCMHLFCGACLEARLETRQRKCPTCSIAFGTNDVSAVYF